MVGRLWEAERGRGGPPASLNCRCQGLVSLSTLSACVFTSGGKGAAGVSGKALERLASGSPGLLLPQKPCSPPETKTIPWLWTAGFWVSVEEARCCLPHTASVTPISDHLDVVSEPICSTGLSVLVPLGTVVLPCSGSYHLGVSPEPRDSGSMVWGPHNLPSACTLGGLTPPYVFVLL